MKGLSKQNRRDVTKQKRRNQFRADMSYPVLPRIIAPNMNLIEERSFNTVKIEEDKIIITTNNFCRREAVCFSARARYQIVFEDLGKAMITLDHAGHV
jgi:hypothetical protein